MPAFNLHRAKLYEFVRQHRLAVISSVADDGTPQSALIGFAITPELNIVFDTLNTSRKYNNLIARPRCSLVIGWANEQTLQVEGTARELAGSDLHDFQAVYFEVWPDGPARMHWPHITYLVISPNWIRYSDYGLNPPAIWEGNVSQLPE